MKKRIFNQIEYNQNYNKEHYSRITILINKTDTSLIDRLKTYAKTEQKTLSEIGYTAIDEYLKNKGF